jgi:hypothetical protein
VLETGHSFRFFHSTSIEPEALLAEPRVWSRLVAPQALYASSKWKGIKTFSTIAASLEPIVRCSLSLPAFDLKNAFSELTFCLARIGLEPDFEASSVGFSPIAFVDREPRLGTESLRAFGGPSHSRLR